MHQILLVTLYIHYSSMMHFLIYVHLYYYTAQMFVLIL